MVLINDKKYSCDRCIKGHRVSSCTHTDRPLYEVKKKGRPATQCKHCKDRRKSTGTSVHTKCVCGSENQAKRDAILLLNSSKASSPEAETRKGQPGSRATFPNGLKDVHELASAANALQGLGDDDKVVKAAERTVQALLNPCKCEWGGACTCCQPKRKQRGKSSSPPKDGPSTPHEAQESSGGCCGSSPHEDIPYKLSTMSYLNPENNPRNTQALRTRLFSPYTTDPRGKRDSLSSGGSQISAFPNSRPLRPPPTSIRPLTDMRRLMNAAVNQDGSLASEIPRSAVGLPGIEAFDAAAKGEIPLSHPNDDTSMALAFPTAEEVIIGACMCGDECSCPGCATHGGAGSPSNHAHDGACGEICLGHQNCANSIPIASGVQSIAQLICVAAAQVPNPPTRNHGSLDPHDTRILPPVVSLSEDAARTMGLIHLKPLECCGGKCGCPPGECTCEKQCCGCCGECGCEKKTGDGDTWMEVEGVPCSAEPEAESSCCGGSKNITEAQPIFASPMASTSPSKPSTSAHMPGPSNIEYHPAFQRALARSQLTSHPYSQVDTDFPSASSSRNHSPVDTGSNWIDPFSSRSVRPRLPKRASDVNAFNKGGPDMLPVLDRSGSLTGRPRSRNEVVINRGRSGAGRSSRSSSHSRSGSARVPRSTSPTQIVPSTVDFSSAANPGYSNIISDDTNSDLMAFMPRPWSNNGGTDVNAGVPMPNPSNVRPWPFPPGNDNEDRLRPVVHPTSTQEYSLEDLLQSLNGQNGVEQLYPSLGGPASGQRPQTFQPSLPPRTQSSPRPDGPGYNGNFADLFTGSRNPGTAPYPNMMPQGGSGWEGGAAQSTLTGVYGQPRTVEGGANAEREDIVDLSKPLDSKSLERIMKALEKQQGQAQAQTQAYPQNQAPRSPSLHLPLVQPQTSQPFDQQPLGQPPKPFYQQFANQSLHSPVATDAVAKELDDMFSQFVTLDGVNPSWDNFSAIDAYGEGMGMGRVGATANGQEACTGSTVGQETRWESPRVW